MVEVDGRGTVLVGARDFGEAPDHEISRRRGAGGGVPAPDHEMSRRRRVGASLPPLEGEEGNEGWSG